MLNGVRLQVANQKAVFLGTDGKRLARATASIAENPSIIGTYVIPLKAVEEMTKLLDDTDTPVYLNLAHDKISLTSGSLTLTTKLLSGQYPDVEKVIPAQVAQSFAIHREELVSLLRQISLFTSEASSSVRFSFEVGQLHLAAMSSEVGEGKVSMPVDYAGPKLEIAFNPYFFLDILRHIKEETFRFGVNDPHSPGLITDSTQALFVIMPMRLNDAPAARIEATPEAEEEVVVQ
jgi:DNA polymerase-3 subunit beta